jgi:serpin B
MWSIFLGLLVFYGAQSVSGQISGLSDITTSLGLQILQTDNASSNIMFSPVSIYFNMALLYAGAKGETKSQISEYVFHGLTEEAVREYLKKVIDIWSKKRNPSGFYNMSYAHAVFVQNQYPLLEEYKSTLLKYYDSYAKSVDFEKTPEIARQEINSWIDEETNHEIRDFYPEHALDHAKMIAINAFYFKANWKNKFNASKTTKQDFFMRENDRSVVDMMSQSNTQFYYFEDDTVQVLGLPFDVDQDRETIMYIILPAKRFRLDDVVSTMTADRFRKIITEGREQPIAKVDLPKFKLQTNWNGTDMFRRLGLTNMFDSKLADFSGVDGSKSLYVSDIRHGFALEINEEGAKGVDVGAIGHRALPVTFKVDQPFMFAFVQKSTLNALLVGRIVKL